MDREEASFNALKRMIFTHTDLDCSQYKNKYLKRRLMTRIRSNGLEGFADYLRFLKKNQDEYDKLIETLTINVTQFFRDSTVFNIIGEEVIPELIYHKTNQNRTLIRVWSAGCASGEETYSIAIMLYELLGERFNELMVSVTGTDIDQESIRKAKFGKYTPEQLENVSSILLDRYFIQLGETYQVNEVIKTFVRFRKQDLFADKKPGHFDMIFNRNVMIYFSREMQERLLMDFYHSLNDGGYLIIGKTEMLTGEAKDLFLPINNRERIYKKEKG